MCHGLKWTFRWAPGSPPHLLGFLYAFGCPLRGFPDLRVSRTTHGILQEPGLSLSRSFHVDTYTVQTFNLEAMQIQTARWAGLLWKYAPSSGLWRTCFGCLLCTRCWARSGDCEERGVGVFRELPVWAVACNQIVFKVSCEIWKPLSHALVTRSRVSGSDELWWGLGIWVLQ